MWWLIPIFFPEAFSNPQLINIRNIHDQLCIVAKLAVPGYGWWREHGSSSFILWSSCNCNSKDLAPNLNSRFAAQVGKNSLKFLFRVHAGCNSFGQWVHCPFLLSKVVAQSLEPSCRRLNQAAISGNFRGVGPQTRLKSWWRSRRRFQTWQRSSPRLESSMSAWFLAQLIQCSTPDPISQIVRLQGIFQKQVEFLLECFYWLTIRKGILEEHSSLTAYFNAVLKTKEIGICMSMTSRFFPRCLLCTVCMRRMWWTSWYGRMPLSLLTHQWPPLSMQHNFKIPVFRNRCTTAHGLRKYATAADLNKEGYVALRPWHLPWWSACGLKGMVETEFWFELVVLHSLQMHLLCQNLLADIVCLMICQLNLGSRHEYWPAHSLEWLHNGC